MKKLSQGQVQELQKQLSLTMGQVRTEYIPDEDVFKMFSQPTYWSKLSGPRPCILVGGRGTGKTTTLKSLSYQGQYSLNGGLIQNWTAIGSYWRIESNVVSVFRGRKLDDDQWTAIFSHYVNLRLVQGILRFLLWRAETLQKDAAIDGKALALTCASLNVPEVDTIDDLSETVTWAIAKLEARLNSNTKTLSQMDLSMLGQPLRYLLEALQNDINLRGKVFTFCLDEFENLEPYQQKIFNTLLKHSGDSLYTFKIGIRDSNVRERETLADGQPLIDPADYSTVNIVQDLKGSEFAQFARHICNQRLAKISDFWPVDQDVSKLLPDLSEEGEADLLGAQQVRRDIRARLVATDVTDSNLKLFDELPTLSACLVQYWSRAKNISEVDALEDAAKNPSSWRDRTNNYSYAMLFTLRQGVRGTRKYYAGWSIYTQIAEGNIRYVLRLVYEALTLHSAKGNGLNLPISADDQSAAAIRIGENSLRELQGLSKWGGQLTRLTLGLGRIFGVMAAQPYGHTPEVTQFHVVRDPSRDPLEVETILRDAVAHGSLIAFASDKHARFSGETKEFDYQLHPIFAPYFAFSHRRKRRMTINSDELLRLTASDARKTIEKILKTKNRDTSKPDLPEQLSMYSEFYYDAD